MGVAHHCLPCPQFIDGGVECVRPAALAGDALGRLPAPYELRHSTATRNDRPDQTKP